MGVDKLDETVELKSSADKFYKTFSCETHKIPNATDGIHSVDVHEGDWETDGSIKLWKYTIDGKTEEFKEKVTMDDANKTVTMTGVGGHCLERFKSYKAIFKVFQDGEVAKAKITIEYEKFNDDDAHPHDYLNFIVGFIKDVDSHLIGA